MKQRKKTMAKTLTITFILIIIVIGFMANFMFRYTTRYLEEERQEVETENLDKETVEARMEEVFGVIGTRMIFLIGASILVGITMLVVTGNRIIKPIKKISDATKKVSNGDFNVELIKVRNDEIGELTDNFNKMTKELQSVEYLQKDFISNVSHEFKTPITAIDGYINLLDDETLSNEERKEYIEIIKEEIKRLTNLTTNVLRLSRMEAREEQQNKEKYLLDEQIRKCILFLEKTWSEKNIEFDLKLKPVKIYAEKELVEQIWINIISNAIKYSKGKITISSNIEESFAIIKIKDRGIGIEKEKINRIFEKFYQAEKSHSKEGNGLGLAITNRIINLCNGEIQVESEIGKGTEFIIKLPITDK